MSDELCIHDNFVSRVWVNRLHDDVGVVIGFAADVHIDCADCGLPFEWMGFPGGVAPDYATTDVISHELRAPIRPCDTEVHALIVRLADTREGTDNE